MNKTIIIEVFKYHAYVIILILFTIIMNCSFGIAVENTKVY